MWGVGRRAGRIFALALAPWIVACAQGPLPDQPLPDLAALPEGYFYCSDDVACLGDDKLTEAQYGEALKRTFDRIEAARGDRSLVPNDTGALSWEESYILRSYLDAYAVTSDPAVMKRAASAVKKILSLRDDVTGAVDYRGISGPTWRTTGYSTKPIAFLVTDGQVASAIAEFARVVLATHALDDVLTDDGDPFRTFANTVLDRVDETVQAHEAEWDATAKLYRIPSDATFFENAGRSVPLNWEAAMARAMNALYRVRGGADRKARLEAMAAHFKAQWVHKTDGTIYWTYWSDGTRTIEDISHAHLNATWMLEGWQAGVGFSYSDVVTVAASFARNVIKSDQSFSFLLDGNGDRTSVTVAVLWLPLAAFDSRIYQACWSFFRAAAANPDNGNIAFNGNSITELLGAAHLWKYRTSLLGSL